MLCSITFLKFVRSQYILSVYILEYITHFIGKLINSANSKNTETIKNECICNTDHLNFSSMKDALYSKDVRKKLLDNGIQDAIRFLQIRM